MDAARPSGPRDLAYMRRFVVLLGGQIALVASQGLLIVALARLGTLSTVGLYGLAVSICAPIFLLANLGLRNARARELDNAVSYRVYQQLRLRTNLLGTAIALMAAVAVDHDGLVFVVLMIALLKCVESQAELSYGELQLHGRFLRIGMSQAGRAISTFVPFMAALLLQTSLLGALGASLLGAGLWTIGFDVLPTRRMTRNASDEQRRIDVADVAATTQQSAFWSLFRSVAPLGFTSVIINLQANMPRYFISHYANLEAVGIFSIQSYVYNAVLIATNSGGAVWLSAYAKAIQGQHGGNRAALLRPTVLLALLAVILCGALLPYAPALQRLLTGTTTAVTETSFRLVVAATACRLIAVPSQYFLIASGRYGLYLVLHLIALVSGLVACLWLIPVFGISGAALALAVSATVASALALSTACILARRYDLLSKLQLKIC